MCVVKKIDECEKRVFINTKDGGFYCSDWFIDPMEKCEATNATKAEIEQYNQLMEKYNIMEENVAEWSVNRNKEQGCIYISMHAQERLRKRNGWNRKAMVRMVQRVYDNGKRSNELKGRARAYIKRKEQKNEKEDEYVVYGDMIYVFNNSILITAFPISNIVFNKENSCLAAE